MRECDGMQSLLSEHGSRNVLVRVGVFEQPSPDYMDCTLQEHVLAEVWFKLLRSLAKLNRRGRCLAAVLEKKREKLSVFYMTCLIDDSRM